MESTFIIKIVKLKKKYFKIFEEPKSTSGSFLVVFFFFVCFFRSPGREIGIADDV